MIRKCFLFWICCGLYGVHAEIPQKIKLYCMYTPQFETLLTDYFLPSIQDDFEVIARAFPQECPSGLFQSEGWDLTMLHKLELLKEAIQENTDNRVFFYSDLDVIFLKPILQRCLELLGDRDFLVQQGWPEPSLCAGFFVMRGNKKNLELIREAERLLMRKLAVDDQVALQKALRYKGKKIHWDFLPAEEFPNGRRVLKQQEHYCKDSEIALPPSIALFHANFCIGLDLKIDFLKRVQSEYLLGKAQ